MTDTTTAAGNFRILSSLKALIKDLKALTGRQLFWLTVFTISSTIVGIRVVWAFSINWVGALFWIGLAALFMRILFLLEGLLVVMTQLRRADEEGARRYISNFTPGYKLSAETYLNCAKSETSFRSFVDGREIFVMLMVVGITFCLTQLPYVTSANEAQRWLAANQPFGTGGGPIRTYLRTHFWLGAVPAILMGLKSVWIEAPSAALIPSWVAQLLPQHLANDRHFEFGREPFARGLKLVCMKIAQWEAGWPARIFRRIATLNGAFTGQEDFGLGPRSIFEQNRKVCTHYIKERKVHVTISSTGCTIREDFAYTILKHVNSFWSSYGLFKKPIGDGELTVKEINGVHIQNQIWAFDIDIENVDDKNPFPNPPRNRRALVAKQIFTPPFDPAPDAPAPFSSVLKYETGPINYMGSTETLSINIEALTEKITVQIIYEDDLVLSEIKPTLGRVVGVIGIPPDESLDHDIAIQYDHDRGVTIEVNHPPQGTELDVSFQGFIRSRSINTPAVITAEEHAKPESE